MTDHDSGTPGAATRSFSYEVDRRALPLLYLLGFRPGRDAVTVTPEELKARLGVVRLATPLANLTGAHVTRGYRWWTAYGVRGSFVDDGLTFGTNHRAGVCIHFAEKVPSPLRRSGHSALTVTVADPEGLASLIGPADDAR